MLIEERNKIEYEGFILSQVNNYEILNYFDCNNKS
jgi:hypothetical protein